MAKTLTMFATLFAALTTIAPPCVAQPTLDGVLSDGDYTLLADSTDGPSSGFGPGHEINALYAWADSASELLVLGLAGNVQNGNRILIFIDTIAGGYSDGDFGRTGAPQGVDDFNSGTTFDAGFAPDYVLAIGTDGGDRVGGNYYWDLFTLAGTAGSGGGSNNYLGDQTDADLAADPANSSFTQGFETRLTFSTTGVGVDLQVTPGPSNIQLFAMYTSDGGFLSNQFMSPAGSGDGDYGSGSVVFGAATPDPLTFGPLPVELLSFSTD